MGEVPAPGKSGRDRLRPKDHVVVVVAAVVFWLYIKRGVPKKEIGVSTVSYTYMHF